MKAPPERALFVAARAAVLGLLMLSGRAGADTADEPDLTWIDRPSIDSGEVQVRAERTDHPLTVQVKVAAIVHAPPEAIWRVLIACDVSPQYVPNVVSCRSLEKINGGSSELFVQKIKAIFFLPTFEHVFRLDYTPYRRIDVHRVSGPIAQLDGSWWLLQQPDGATLLVYEVAVDPGMPVPRFFVRATLRRDLPRVVAAVRERAEAPQ
jgi:polyketide cyclase/dehydrase/lipid transport protein